MAARNSVVLPAPFGPIRTVGAPGASVSETPSRIVTAPATMSRLREHDGQVGGGCAHGHPA